MTYNAKYGDSSDTDKSSKNDKTIPPAPTAKLNLPTLNSTQTNTNSARQLLKIVSL